MNIYAYGAPRLQVWPILSDDFETALERVAAALRRAEPEPPPPWTPTMTGPKRRRLVIDE